MGDREVDVDTLLRIAEYFVDVNVTTATKCCKVCDFTDTHTDGCPVGFVSRMLQSIEDDHKTSLKRRAAQVLQDNSGSFISYGTPLQIAQVYSSRLSRALDIVRDLAKELKL